MQPPAKQTASWSSRAEVRLAALSLLLGIVLMSSKLAAYYITRSTAIFSDAMENVVNVLSAAFALYALLLAHQPADEEHPYGHGKVEFLSAAFEGGMMLLATILIMVQAGGALWLGIPPQRLNVGLAITAMSTVLCAGMGFLMWRRGKRGGSMTLEADGIHLLSDSVTGVVVLAALMAVRLTNQPILDPLAALAVSLWVALQAARLMRRAAAGLMDEQDEADAVLLNRILNSHIGADARDPRICSFHKLRHRHSGRVHWVDFHIQVPAGWAVEQGHRVATSIEMEIERSLTHCSATAHVEPCVNSGCRFCQATEVPV
jgi:cation diffusion facilitator family transporter